MNMKFVTGPYKGLCFRIVAENYQSRMRTLEFYNATG